MPRTAITVTEVTRAAPAQPAQQNSDNANNMSLPWNDGKLFLEIGGIGSTAVCTILIPGLVDGQTVPPLSVSVAAAGFKVVGPFPPYIYNQSDGTVQINCADANGRYRCYHVNS